MSLFPSWLDHTVDNMIIVTVVQHGTVVHHSRLYCTPHRVGSSYLAHQPCKQGKELSVRYNKVCNPQL